MFDDTHLIMLNAIFELKFKIIH